MRKKIQRKMKKNKKIIALSAISIVLIISLFMVIRTIVEKKTVTQENIKYEYKLKRSIKYNVHIIENEIYDENILSEDLTYPQKLVDYIDIDFLLDFEGSESSPINIDYKLNATLNGYRSKDDVKTIYWAKTFPLKEETLVQITNNLHSINEEIKVILLDYILFVEKAQEITGLSISNEVIFNMEGNITTVTQYGDVKLPFNLSLTAPLNDPAIKLTKSDLNDISDKITEKVVIILPVNKRQVAIYSVIAFSCILGIIYLCMFTVDYDIRDTLICIIKKFISDFGSRMIALQNNILKSYEYQYDVHSMKDLVKVSDELQKPIFYEVDDQDIVKDFKFCVQNGNELYVYNAIDALDEKWFHKEEEQPV